MKLAYRDLNIVKQINFPILLDTCIRYLNVKSTLLTLFQAASRHKCPYLVRLLKDHFLLQGGDKEWLKGINHAPPKLQILASLNKLLAHRPWLVTSEHIKVSFGVRSFLIKFYDCF